MQQLDGEAHIERIPDTVQSVELNGVRVKSWNGMTALPQTLKVLHVVHTASLGPFAAADLPASLCELDLTNNAMQGTWKSADFPRELGHLSIAENQLQ